MDVVNFFVFLIGYLLCAYLIIDAGFLIKDFLERKR